MTSMTRGRRTAVVAEPDLPRDLPAEPLGPGSVYWYLTGDWRTLLIAFRALVYQTAYPMVGAGVGEYSVYKSDPYGRLNRTFGSLMAQTYGGAGAARARPDLGPYCYEPTVLAEVTDDMAVCMDETFGPVISLYRFASDHEALTLANKGSYGLSASIWSRDVDAALAMAPKVRAGSVNINDGAAAAAGSIEAHMGGMGDSGLGRRHGAEGIRKYTEPQTVAVQRLMALGPHPSMSVDRFVDLGNAQLRVLRRLRVR